MTTKYLFNVSTFREEKLLRRSRQRLEAVQIEKAFDRATERHESLKLKIDKGRENSKTPHPSPSIDKLCTDKVDTSGSGGLSSDLSITHSLIAEDVQVPHATLSNSLIDRGKNAEDYKNVMGTDAIKIRNIDANLAYENAASTVHPVVRSSSSMTTHKCQKESKTPDKARYKDSAKLSSLISKLEDKKGLNLISDTMYEQLQQWKSAIEIWDENQLLGIKHKTFIPLRVGSKSIDIHSMREKNLDYKGKENSNRNPHGQGKVIFENGDWMSGEFRDGMRQGLGTMRTGLELARYLDGRVEDCKVSFIDGTFVADKLEGPGKIEWDNGDVLVCNFVQGVVHGFTKLFDSHKKLKHVCWYQNGIPYGYSWQFCEGGGFLVGELDQFGNFSGRQMAFLYPDLKTGLYGVFSSGRMVSAGPAAVQLASKKDNIFSLLFKRLPGSGYNYDPATRQSISSRPLLRDPYETEYVSVALCKIVSKGEGLFVTKSVSANTILAFYNGFKLHGEECIKSDNWEDDAYKIMDLLPSDDTESGVLDIPPEYQSTENYCASLAHKANHSFKPNAKFCLCYHPRFGPVPALQTLQPVQSGSEVLVNYEYAYDEAPPWFTSLYSQQLTDAYQLIKDRGWETAWGYQREV